jgi:hypothetical protein
MTLVLNLEGDQKKLFETIALRQGKKPEELLETVIADFISAERESEAWTRLSEASFNEWDNEDDAIYDTL